MSPDLTIPSLQNRHRLWAIFYGAVLLVWLTPEDSTILIVCVLGWGLALMIALLCLFRWWGNRTFSPCHWIPGFMLLGAMIGAGAVFCTLGLMIFKNAWHSHIYLDFPGEVIVGVIQRLPFWSMAGSFFGGAAALLRLTLVS